MRNVLLALTGLVAVLAITVAAAGQGPTPDRWEYAVQFGEGSGIKPERHQRQLDSLGQHGWELVSVIGVQMSGHTGTAILYLKRRTP